MKNSPRWFALIAAAAFAAPTTAEAQNGVPADSWTISFAVPEGGGSSFGLGRTIGSGLRLGLDIDLQSSDSDLAPTEGSIAAESETDDKNFVIGPSAQLYFGGIDDIAPFLRVGANMGWSNNEQRQTNAIRIFDTFQWSISGAAGAEWFPAERISVGGYTGIFLRYIDAENTLNGNGVTQDTWSISTFRSNLTFSLWF